MPDMDDRPANEWTISRQIEMALFKRVKAQSMHPLGSISLYVCSLSLLLVICSRGAAYEDASSNPSSNLHFLRPTRSFPYSVSFLRMMRPPTDRDGGMRYVFAPMTNSEQEIADLIDSLDVPANPMGRDRRSTGFANVRLQFAKSMVPGIKRNSLGYACRFKFCRIFDA